MIRARKLVLPTLLGLGLGTGALAYYDEGFRRSGIFWSKMFPIYLHYRFYQFEDEVLHRKVDYNELHDMYAPRVEELAMKMRGYYLKNAQTFSTRDDFFPPQYLTWMKKTQGDCTSTLKHGEWREIFEKSTGKKVDDVFESYEDEPIGIASIGEVHKCKLKGGKVVVVKVQAQGIERIFRNDMGNIIRFCKMAMPHFLPALQEIEKQFLTEFDYVGEAKNLELVSKGVMAEWGEKVFIPLPVVSLCTKEVLVMDYVPGKRLVDGLKDNFRKIAKEQGISYEELEEKFKKEVKIRDIEEEKKQSEKIKRMLMVKDVFNPENVLRFVNNYTPFRFVFGYRDYQWSTVPINLSNILELLLHVHAYEIFQVGDFNGDPHPGNILLMPDGRLGLIDYGQVKHLELQDRLTYAKLIVALSDDDRDEVARIQFEEFKVLTKKMDKNIAYRLTAFWNDRDTEDITEGRNLQAFLDYCEATDQAITLGRAENTIMASRVSLLLRGMGNAFGIRMKTASYFRPYAIKLLEEHNVDYKGKKKDGKVVKI